MPAVIACPDKDTDACNETCVYKDICAHWKKLQKRKERDEKEGAEKSE